MRQYFSIKNLSFLLVSLGALYWILTWVELETLFATVKSARYDLLAVAALLTTVSYVLRALRWPLFFAAQPPRFKDSYRCLVLGFFMNNVLPARLGEFVRAHLGGRATNQSRARVLATIAAERLADGLAISLIFGILFTVASRPEEKTEAAELFYVAYAFGAVGLLTAVFLSQRHLAFRLLEKLGALFPGRLSNYVIVRIGRFIEGLEGVFAFRRIVLITFWSLIVWGTELFVFYLVATAYHQQLSLGGLSLFLAAVNFSSLIPSAPAAIGVIEAFATLALTQIGLQKETALAMVASQHLIQFCMIAIPGLMFFFIGMHGKLPSAIRRRESLSRSLRRKSEKRSGGRLAEPAACELSLIIPAYNEESRLGKTLTEVVNFLQQHYESFEVLVIDDGSTDQTASVVERYSKQDSRVRMLTYPRNRGKGYAVRFGMTNSAGELLLFADADGSTPIEELTRLAKRVTEGADIAIGSRALTSDETEVETSLRRKIIGRVFATLVNFVAVRGIADTQCGFKLFNRNAAKELFSRAQADGFSFDVELLLLARKLDLKIAEVPVNWTNAEGSKVNLVVDSLKMLRDIFKFRFKYQRGDYAIEDATAKLDGSSLQAHKT